MPSRHSKCCSHKECRGNESKYNPLQKQSTCSKPCSSKSSLNAIPVAEQKQMSCRAEACSNRKSCGVASEFIPLKKMSGISKSNSNSRQTSASRTAAKRHLEICLSEKPTRNVVELTTQQEPRKLTDCKSRAASELAMQETSPSQLSYFSKEKSPGTALGLPLRKNKDKYSSTASESAPLRKNSSNHLKPFLKNKTMSTTSQVPEPKVCRKRRPSTESGVFPVQKSPSLSKTCLENRVLSATSSETAEERKFHRRLISVVKEPENQKCPLTSETSLSHTASCTACRLKFAQQGYHFLNRARNRRSSAYFRKNMFMEYKSSKNGNNTCDEIWNYVPEDLLYEVLDQGMQYQSLVSQTITTDSLSEHFENIGAKDCIEVEELDKLDQFIVSYQLDDLDKYM